MINIHFDWALCGCQCVSFCVFGELICFTLQLAWLFCILFSSVSIGFIGRCDDERFQAISIYSIYKCECQFLLILESNRRQWANVVDLAYFFHINRNIQCKIYISAIKSEIILIGDPSLAVLPSIYSQLFSNGKVLMSCSRDSLNFDDGCNRFR